MTPKEILDLASEYGRRLLYPDGMEDAIIEVVERFGMSPVILLDRQKCIEIYIERDGMDEEEANEFFDFNTIGAWMGEATPAFATIYRQARDLKEMP